MPTSNSLGRQANKLELFAIFALVGSILFVASAMLLPYFREDRTLTTDSISSLLLGQYGHLEQVAFYAIGISSLGLSWSIRQTTKGSKYSRLGSSLVGFWSINIFLAGATATLFNISTLLQIEWSNVVIGVIHIVAATLACVSVVAGILVLSKTFKEDDRWHSFRPWSLGMGFAALLTLFLLIMAVISRVLFGWPLWGAAVERTFLILVVLWLVFAALRLRFIAKDARANVTSN